VAHDDDDNDIIILIFLAKALLGIFVFVYETGYVMFRCVCVFLSLYLSMCIVSHTNMAMAGSFNF